jgi:phosphatidylglycerophosphate synthase
VHLPDDSLRRSAAATLATALALVVCAALLARANLPLTAWYPLKAALWFTAAIVLVLGAISGRHPFSRFGGANQVTTMRVGIVALLAGLVGDPSVPLVAATACAASSVALLLDGVDGFLARRTRMASAFGARFDMETDGALIQVLATLAWQYGKAGRWILLSGLLRYLFIAAGWVAPWMQRPLRPSRRGRTVCVLQIAALILAIAPQLTPTLGSSIAAAGLAALCYSFGVDTLWLWRRRLDRALDQRESVS